MFGNPVGIKGQRIDNLLTSHFMDEVEALCDEICILKKERLYFTELLNRQRKPAAAKNLKTLTLCFSERW